MSRLSPTTCDRIRTLAEMYPERRTALLPALKLAQADVGHLPPEVIAEAADLVGVPHAAAYELVDFYTMLHPEREGATRVVVCCQLPCALRGANRLLRDLSRGLGIEPGETTPDGAVTLERTSECFGACHRAPMARVNDEYRENLDPDATRRLLSELSPLLLGEGQGEGGAAANGHPSPGALRAPTSPRGRGRR